MVKFQTSGAISALFVCQLLVATSAAPASTHDHSLQRRSFKVEQVQVEKPRLRNAARSMRHAFNKYGWTVPDILLDASSHESSKTLVSHAGNITGSVENRPVQNDIEYLSPINVGGQTMMVNFDTGSSDLWLFSAALPATSSRGHQVFDPAKSTSFKRLPGQSWSINYSDGSGASGNLVGTDIVNIGGASVEQVVELATSVSGSLVRDTASNGLVGLAFSTSNTVRPTKARTFFETIQNELVLPVMTANLRKGAVGSYEFGKINDTAYTGSLNIVPVDASEGYWQFPSSCFAVGDGPILENMTASPAIADTGTTLMLVTPAVAETYYSNVEGAFWDRKNAVYHFPCGSDLPDFHVALGRTYMATIAGDLILFSQSASDSSLCVGSIQPNFGAEQQIYGDILFKSQLAVFNIQDKNIGFAAHA